MKNHSCRGCGTTTSWYTSVEGEVVPVCKKCLDEGKAIVADPRGVVLSGT